MLCRYFKTRVMLFTSAQYLTTPKPVLVIAFLRKALTPAWVIAFPLKSRFRWGTPFLVICQTSA